MSIRYHEAEKLFKAWPTIEAIVDGLSVDIKYFRKYNSTGTDADYIYSMVVGNKVLNDMPPTGKISDSSGNIAANYQSNKRFDKKEIRIEIGSELHFLLSINQKMEIAFKRPSPVQREILKLFYWEELPWKEVLDIINQNSRYISESTAKAERMRGIKKMAIVLGTALSMEDYNAVMKIVDENLASK